MMKWVKKLYYKAVLRKLPRITVSNIISESTRLHEDNCAKCKMYNGKVCKLVNVVVSEHGKCPSHAFKAEYIVMRYRQCKRAEVLRSIRYNEDFKQ